LRLDVRMLDSLTSHTLASLRLPVPTVVFTSSMSAKSGFTLTLPDFAVGIGQATAPSELIFKEKMPSSELASVAANSEKRIRLR